MGAYRLVIGCNFNQYENGSTEPNRYLILDCQEDRNVDVSATLATQPLQNGDTMTDHMYRNPVKFTVNGSFSINGKNWADDSYSFMEKGDRLTNIQEVFEKISNDGILCTLTTIDEDDYNYDENGVYSGTIKSNAKNRFKIRKNMALERISWIEKQNTVKFTFNFAEVIMVEAQEYEELSEEEREALGLPRVTSPIGSSLGQVLADTGELPKIIIKSLYDNGYIDNEFLEALATIGMAILSEVIFVAVLTVGLTVAAITAAGAAVAVAGAVGAGTSVLTAIGGSVSAIFPVGTIIVAVVAVVAAVALAISNFINWRNKQEKQKRAFKLINGSAEQDGYRLQDLIDKIEIEINKINSNLTIYSINGEYEQQVIINIAGEYYVINFLKNSTNGEWYAEVKDMNGNELTTVRHSWSPVTCLTDMSPITNMWFKDKTKQYEVYLVNPSLSQDVNATEEELENVKKKLEGYTIWVSKGNVRENIDKVLDTINDALMEEGFV